MLKLISYQDIYIRRWGANSGLSREVSWKKVNIFLI